MSVGDRIAEILDAVPLADLQASADALAEAGAGPVELRRAIAGLLDALVPFEVIVPGPAGELAEAVDRLVFAALVGPIIKAAQRPKARRRRLQRRLLLDGGAEVSVDVDVTGPADGSGEETAPDEHDGSGGTGPGLPPMAAGRRLLRRRRPLLAAGGFAGALAVIRQGREDDADDDSIVLEPPVDDEETPTADGTTVGGETGSPPTPPAGAPLGAPVPA